MCSTRGYLHEWISQSCDNSAVLISVLAFCQSTFFRVFSTVRILIIHNYSSFFSYQRKQLYTEVIGMDKHGNGGDKDMDERERGVTLKDLWMSCWENKL